MMSLNSIWIKSSCLTSTSGLSEPAILIELSPFS